MKYDIQDVFNFDDEYFDSFADLANSFVPLAAQSNFASTFTTLTGLLASANSIKLGIFDLAEESDTHLYIIRILKRTLIEHYLKFYYVLFRFLDEGSDEVGEEYRKYSSISETISQLKAIDISFSIQGDTSDISLVSAIREKYPELQISNRELNSITDKWKHRSIVRHIIEHLNLIENQDQYLLGLIPEYSALSSYIHGGVSAEQCYHEAISSGELEKLVYLEVQECLLMTISMRLHILLAVIKIDDSYKEGQEKLSKMLNKYLEENT